MSTFVKVVDVFNNVGEKISVSCSVLVEPITTNTYPYQRVKDKKFTAVINTKNSSGVSIKRSKLRVFFNDKNSIQPVNEEDVPAIAFQNSGGNVEIEETQQYTDEELSALIEDKFFSVGKFADAASKLKIRSLLVSGTAGTGKTYEVMTALEKEEKANKNFKFSVVKGTISPIALYIELYNCRDGVLVLDDCDSALFENESLQLLKAATESHKYRRVSYKKMSSALEEYGIPQEFNFEGAVIILTNTNLEKGGKNRLPHFEAIISRAHYINAVLSSDREKLLRIRSVIKTSGILKMYLPNEDDHQSVIDFIEDNYQNLRELSVRTVVKVSELRAAFPEDWLRLANSTIRK